MKIAILSLASKSGDEVVSIKARVLLDKPPHDIKTITQEAAKEGWKVLETVDLCDHGYFSEHRLDLELVENLNNLATRLASVAYFKGNGHGHSEAVMER